jgi:hypothetical protein
MTPKKDIVRRPVYTLDDGSPIPSMGKEFTMKESRFIFWYTNPGTEAFMNAGRAAVRAGYKESSAVWQGYQLKRKPRIAKMIDSRLVSVHEELKETIFKIVRLCMIRMNWIITDFYRDGKKTVIVKGKPKEIEIFEIIPLEELSWKQQMCIDGIIYKGPYDVPLYILPDREKVFKIFMQYYEILEPISDNEEMDWKATAEIIRENVNVLPGNRNL